VYSKYTNFTISINLIMNQDISHTNRSFDYLSKSDGFLNLIIHNISSCVLLLNNEMMLMAYNEPLKAMFSDKDHNEIMYQKCGNVIGCALAVEEEKECGTTSHCRICSLRESALKTYINGIVVYKEIISREFYISKHKKELKHLQFSTRIFNFEDEKYILLIINDITPLV
jgi:hypothetical protein